MQDIPLPPPGAGPAGSLFAALGARRTVRAIQDRPLAPAQLSDLLWAAWGVNRPAGPSGPFGQCGRTAASASNSQEILLHVVLETGAYRYDAEDHVLRAAADGDLRRLALTPGQADAFDPPPAQLVFVADLDRLVHTQGFQEPGLRDPEVQKSYAFVDAGLIAQNVYLYAAAAGLAAWFHNCDRAGLAQGLGLAPSQQVLFAQSVGVPAQAAG